MSESVPIFTTVWKTWAAPSAYALSSQRVPCTLLACLRCTLVPAVRTKAFLPLRAFSVPVTSSARSARGEKTSSAVVVPQICTSLQFLANGPSSFSVRRLRPKCLKSPSRFQLVPSSVLSSQPLNKAYTF